MYQTLKSHFPDFVKGIEIMYITSILQMRKQTQKATDTQKALAFCAHTTSLDNSGSKSLEYNTALSLSSLSAHIRNSLCLWASWTLPRRDDS